MKRSVLWLCLPALGRGFSPIKRSLSLKKRPLTRPQLTPIDEPTELGGPLLQLLQESQPAQQPVDLIGEDSGAFKWKQEKWGALGETQWATFFAAVGTILSALAVLWIYPATGYSDDFLAWLESAAGSDSHLVTLAFGIIFPAVHSGLASLRPYGEKVVGARVWRVVFAWPSLCLAYSWITYFIAHAHDGVVMWDFQANPAAHAISWAISFASFFFLYPSVFNLKEVHS